MVPLLTQLTEVDCGSSGYLLEINAAIESEWRLCRREEECRQSVSVITWEFRKTRDIILSDLLIIPFK